MTDILSKTKRSWNMSRIKGKNTKPELTVRSCLHKMGYRFRIHKKDLPGVPDIVLPKYKTIIFVHGCFWHRHKGCKYTYTPKSRIDFWNQKFSDNQRRFKEVKNFLIELGWKVEMIWECETKDTGKLKNRIKDIFSN